MKRAALILFALALCTALFGGVQHAGRRIATLPPVRYDGSASVAIVRALTRLAPRITLAARDDDRDLPAILTRLRAGEPGTYIGDILLERDSALIRWPDRAAAPLTVWIQPRASIADFSADFIAQVRVAFASWDSLELPVRFVFVKDSATAEVHVNWIDRFAEPISGRTRWARDENWTITDANIVLAVHHHQGEVLDGDSMKAMALHEIGHLLGLDHTTDSTSIMAPRVRVRELSGPDRATVRLLYALPAGPLR